MDALRTLRDFISPLASKILGTKWKEMNELAYWKVKKSAEGEFVNDYYEYFYTEHFGIEKSFFDNKTIMDLGCGPRGSLEWADNTKRRIGVDPLANKYLQLGAKNHKMEYLATGSENIQMDSASCDVIFSFNSFDHVESVEQSAKEIKRCLKSGGLFLLLVEVNHEPTACEPHKLSPKGVLELFGPEFVPSDIKAYELGDNGMYNAIKSNNQISNPLDFNHVGYISVKFQKI